MNNKKALLVVILSAFFALIVALLLFKNQGISENVAFGYAQRCRRCTA